ncbi:hypothetical protein MRX96_008536 [Rhipicephalus microplus]
MQVDAGIDGRSGDRLRGGIEVVVVNPSWSGNRTEVLLRDFHMDRDRDLDFLFRVEHPADKPPWDDDDGGVMSIAAAAAVFTAFSVTFSGGNGATASGLFCAASFLADQLKAERHADVLMAARTVRQHRPTFLPCLNQYRLLYEVACALATPKHRRLR